MDMAEDRYFQKELEKIERQQRNLHDQYNSEENQRDLGLYAKDTFTNHDYSPHPNQTLASYLIELGIYVKTAQKKAEKMHITCKGGAWYTHRSPLGCFMCEDTQLIYHLYGFIQYLAAKLPSNTTLTQES